MVELTANVLFSGIGAQERGINNTGCFTCKVLNTSDIDKDATLAYAAIHCGLTKEMIENYDEYPSVDEMVEHLEKINLGYDPIKNKVYDWKKIGNRKNKYEIKKYWLAAHLSHNLGDISKIDRLPYADLMTLSSPCTDISLAGKMKGLDPDSGTRSSLLWQCLRLLKNAKEDNVLPKYLLLENVKNLVGKKFIDDFKTFVELMDEIGYNSYWKVLNAKECGIPQNRERVFCIWVRKDIDTGNYEFPIPFDNGLRLKDMLQPKEEIEDKYYLSQEVQDRLQITDETLSKNVIGTTKPEYRTIGQRDEVFNKEGTMGTLTATDYKQPKQIIDNQPTIQESDNVNTEPKKEGFFKKIFKW